MAMTRSVAPRFAAVKRRPAAAMAARVSGARPVRPTAASSAFPILDAPGAAHGDGLLRGVDEVPGVGADQRRTAGGGGLDQVLPAEGEQAAAHVGQVGGGIVGRHFPHAVAQEHADIPGGPTSSVRRAQGSPRSWIRPATSGKRWGWRGTSTSRTSAPSRPGLPAAGAPRHPACWPPGKRISPRTDGAGPRRWLPRRRAA
jgi:hypothetical protein